MCDATDVCHSEHEIKVVFAPELSWKHVVGARKSRRGNYTGTDEFAWKFPSLFIKLSANYVMLCY